VEVASGGLLLTVSQYLQFVHGYSARETGLALAPMALGMIASSSMAATLGQKLGNRPLVAAGLTVVAAGFGLRGGHRPGPVRGRRRAGAARGDRGADGRRAPEHAGVGSALNDTVQQAGAALGVAALGSVVAGTFTGAMPASAPEPARHSTAEALGVAAGTGDAGLAEAARDAFTTAMSVTTLTGAGAVLAAAVLALLVLRDRKPTTAQPTPVKQQATVAATADQ
jgi:DHA2 family multidrug resistance protein-like MFS transporter